MIREWFIKRNDNVRYWWQANPVKRGLAATSLVFIILTTSFGIATVALGAAYHRQVAWYDVPLNYHTQYNNTASVRQVTFSVPVQVYETYLAMPHEINSSLPWDQYADFCDGAYLDGIANAIRASLGWGATDEQVVAAVLSFVQDKYDGLHGLHYHSDPPWTEYPKYPVETLVDRGGDCEDLSILFTSMVSVLGFDAVLIVIEGHMFAGVALDSPPTHGEGIINWVDYGGTRYYCCECTAWNFNIGILDAASAAASLLAGLDVVV